MKKFAFLALLLLLPGADDAVSDAAAPYGCYVLSQELSEKEPDSILCGAYTVGGKEPAGVLEAQD